jgi:hypothetical protein
MMFLVQKAVLVEIYSSQQQQQPIKIPHQSSGNLLYAVVNKEVEQQF